MLVNRVEPEADPVTVRHSSRSLPAGLWGRMTGARRRPGPARAGGGGGGACSSPADSTKFHGRARQPLVSSRNHIELIGSCDISVGHGSGIVLRIPLSWRLSGPRRLRAPPSRVKGASRRFAMAFGRPLTREPLRALMAGEWAGPKTCPAHSARPRRKVSTGARIRPGNVQ